MISKADTAYIPDEECIKKSCGGLAIVSTRTNEKSLPVFENKEHDQFSLEREREKAVVIRARGGLQ